jgi:hypothetical protein
MAPPSTSGRPRPLGWLVLGILLFGGGGAFGLWQLSHGKTVGTWLSGIGVGAAGQATYVRIVSWAGIVLGVLCIWLLVRELKNRRAR